MDRGSVLIRPAAREDVPAVAAIVRDENPAWVFSDRGWQHRWESAPARSRLVALVAVADEKIVGHGGAGLNPSTSVQGAGGLGVTVLDFARGNGIGSRLYDALLEHLKSVGGRNVIAIFVQNDSGERFARTRGFVHVKSAPISRVDPRTVELTIADDPGFRVQPLAALRDRPRDIFDLDAIAALDEPAVNPTDAPRYEDWELAEWRHPDLELNGSSVVLSGDKPVALSLLRVDAERGRGVSAFTATLPEFRGRGLATRAKARTLLWAAEHGITSIATANDDSNLAMLAINRRLGFKPIGTLVTYQREL